MRWCAEGFEAGRELDTRVDGEPGPDRYLLALWPSAPTPDAVVRQRAGSTAHWHEHARSLPPR